MRKDEQSLKALQSLAFGHPMDPDTITGVSMATFKNLAGMKLIEFIPSRNGGKDFVQITSDGRQVLNWAMQVKPKAET
jgi:hypothetical protein